MGELVRLPDSVTVQIRLRDPQHWDDQGNLYVDPGALEWVDIKIVPGLTCTCKLQYPSDADEQTMCVDCVLDWTVDWEINSDPDKFDRYAVEQMLGRLV